MPSDSGQTTSNWMTTSLPRFTPLAENTHASVCIIGAGIAGLTTAHLLAAQGKEVIVLDDGPIGSGETGRTTAHLSSVLDHRYYELERLHGAEAAQLAASSHAQAIDLIEAIVHRESIDCDFQRLDGYLFAPPDQSTQELDRELETTFRFGLDTELLPRAPIDSFNTGPAIRFPRQGQFHPLKYLAGLACRVQDHKGRIHTGSRVVKVEGDKVTLANGSVVTAPAIVVATNVPFNDRITIHTKQAAYRTYVIGALVESNSVAPALYWDTADPYHYVRTQKIQAADGSKAYDLLIVGGEDHKTGQADDMANRFRRLESWARERFPMIQALSFQWSGQVVEPMGGLAFIGHNPHDQNNIFIATGTSGNGMTYGTIAGSLITDQILGRANPWASLYAPTRQTVGALTETAHQALNVMKQYADWATKGEVSSPEEIPSGSGAIMRQGLKKVAIYRDHSGEIHKLGATCPHLGCIVHWNAVESSWDCPCHGSRFNPTGRVVNGPAASPLSPVD